MQKEPKFKTFFSFAVQKAELTQENVAKASLSELRQFLPTVDTEVNYDLLPISFSACVVNMTNRNDDLISTEEGLAIYKNFLHKYINVNHERQKSAGVILTAGLSEYETEKPLNEADIKDGNKPFNIVLGGVLWRVVNSKLCDIIEELNEKNDSNSLACSWELGFDSYDIVILPEGKLTLDKAEIVKDGTADIEKLKPFLRANGGKGQLEDGRKVYRKLNNVMALGIGIVSSPAAYVEGIATAKIEETITVESLKPLVESAVIESIQKQLQPGGLLNFSNSQEKLKNISLPTSQSSEIDVKHCDKIMKIVNLKDITDESLKEVKASQIAEFIESELKKASEEFTKTKTEKESALAEAKKLHDETLASKQKLEADLEVVKKQLEVLAKEKEDREKQEKFDTRMASFDSIYDLNKEDREVLAKQIRDLSDEAYASFQKTAEVLMKEKNKAHKAALAEKAKESKASVEAKTATQLAEEAVDKGQKEAKITVPNTAPANLTLKEKYKKAFAIDQFDIQLGRK